MTGTDIVVPAPALTPDNVSVALMGHLHAHHEVTERLWYCGSPMGFTFGDGAEHGIMLYDTVSGDCKFIENPYDRKFVTLKADPEQDVDAMWAGVPGGAFVRVVADHKLSDGARLAFESGVEAAGAILEGIVEKVPPEVRPMAKAVASAPTDADAVRAYCTEKGGAYVENVDAIIELLEEVEA
jgi:hypothetical protein